MISAISALSLVLFMCLLLAVEDFTLPTNVRLLSPLLFGIAKENPEEFYKRYNAKRRRRAVFALGLALVSGLAHGFGTSMAIQGLSVVVAVAGYGGLIFFDMLRSRPLLPLSTLDAPPKN